MAARERCAGGSTRSLLLVFGVLAASCGDGRAPPEKVAARVNGEPITVREVRAYRDATPGRDAKQAMESIIDRRLILQRAREQELDRAPGVEAAIALARERIIVQAYLERLADRRYRFDPAGVRRFYAEHPALFAERRVYRLFELTAAAAGEDVERLKAKARQSKSLYEVAEWLKARRMPFNIGAATKAAEQIAPGMLERLSAMRDGEMAVLAIGGGVSVIQVIHSELKPVSKEDADERIERHFWRLALAEAAPEELKRLRSKARIEYLLDADRESGVRTMP